MDPSTSQSGLSAAPAAASFIPSDTYLVNMKATAANFTSTYLRSPSHIDWARIPIQIFHHMDPAVFLSLPRRILQATGLVGQTSGFKSCLGMLQYLTSRWAFTCFAMALILNRISVYGASRHRIVLRWAQRLALRMIPMLLLAPQIYRLLCGIRCQSSPNYSLYRHGNNDRYSPLDWSTDGGMLYHLSSTILYASTDEQACAAVGMSRPSPDVRAPYGSFALLWPTFLTLSVAHLAESLSCSLQQQPLMTEVGMSVFEHSLAFAEVETMITTTLAALAAKARAQNAAAAPKFSGSEVSSGGTIVASGTIMALSDALSSFTTPHVLDKVNVPVEVLLVALLSCCNALSSSVISVLGKQRKWRLINTGFWGLCFMASFAWGFASTSMMSRVEQSDSRPVSSLLHFPTVAIVGFLPHMVILAGIAVCMAIYALALTLTAFSLDSNPSIPQPASFKQRLAIAHENLQAALQLKGITIHWHEDFYTALLRVGFAALTAASEAVFLNEGRSVEMRQFTWLEEERLDELQLSRARPDDASNSNFQILEEYGLPSSSPGGSDKGGVWESGYALERKFDKKEGELEGKDSFAYPTPRPGGIGAVQRTTRFYLLFIYLRGILFLVGGWLSYGLGLLLDRVGVTSRPRWLRRAVGRSVKRMRNEGDNMTKNDTLLDFWLMKDDKGNVATNDSVDVEAEMRRKATSQYGEGEAAEQALDENLYTWWKAGGWFGSNDGSGSYAPSLVDDQDLTSEVSFSSRATTPADDEWESEPEDEGQKTPTQEDQRLPTWSFGQVRMGRNRIREETPEPTVESPLEPATLARLLNPRDAASREEARILSAHLSTLSDDPLSPSRIMTRSRYRKQQESERARVLLAGRTSRRVPAVSLYSSSVSTGPLSATEEEDALEQLILSRRRKPHPAIFAGDGDDDGNEDEIRGAPCVVCHSSARTIIAWPCRCLCVCEDCRVSLALNNFGNCVTCRRQVSGFLRLYVP
ncbi:hypothetical protein DV735_g4523, partial [Chaetothyriales sp. CBS 134920]